ncbi:MAG TPA: YggT family protein [Dehalococcoidia bacterium]|nr:YggT family protein [Dehalococcoidia bacterium]
MIAQIVLATVYVLSLLIFIRAILSFFPGIVNPRGSISEFLYTVTEPVLAPIRAILPSMGGIDLSPMVAIFVLQIAGNALAGAL